ncbi:MAG: hypothetical protein ACAI44_06560 [Candidatus Sericytochromatia bacterium]
MQSKTLSHFKSGFLAGMLLMTACGKGEDLPSDLSGSLSSQLKAAAPTDHGLTEALPKILDGLADIKDELAALRQAGLRPGTSAKPGTAAKPGSKPTTGSTPSTRPSGSTATASPAPAKPAGPTGTETLLKVLKTTSDAPFVSLVIEKTEKRLDNGNVAVGRLNMWTKKPNVVKIEATYDSGSSNAGTKLMYTSGLGDKVKVRPSGALSFVSVELAKNDDRVDTANRYPIDEIDLFGLVGRLSQGYTAELVGKTQLNGTELHVLKVTTSGTNNLDERIAYEHIGYEPGTQKIRLWECFTADSKEPYMRVVMLKIEFPASIPDSTFKI